jgi:plastocyanin
MKQTANIFHPQTTRLLQWIRKAVFILSSLSILIFLNPVPVDAASPSTGTVSGNVGIFRTKVKTDGPKNDKDVIVFLQSASGDTLGPVKEQAIMDQKGLIFLPHVMPIQLGTTVTFLNNDNELHNVYFLFDKTGETLDIGTWDFGQTVDYTFNEAGMAITLCKLHLEMAAYIVVLDTPFYTLAEVDGSNQKGQYEIKDVPAGRYILSSWHKKLKMKGGPVQVTIEGGKTTASDIIMTKAKYAK